MVRHLVICGANGRMGRMITDFALKNSVIEHITALVSSGEEECFAQNTYDRLCVTSHSAEAMLKADLVIDFSSIEAVSRHVSLAAQTGANYLCGVTGLKEQDFHNFELAARHIGVLWASNTSLGVTLMHMLAETIAASLDHEYDVEIIEKHHRHKKDSPSGTAITLGKAVARGRGKSLENLRLPPHDGIAEEREKGKIGFSSVRGGEIIGEHQIAFLSALEEIEIHHRATDRSLFAKGALDAALWLYKKTAGNYTMQDVLSQDVLSQDVLSQDVLSQDVLSLHKINE